MAQTTGQFNYQPFGTGGAIDSIRYTNDIDYANPNNLGQYPARTSIAFQLNETGTYMPSSSKSGYYVGDQQHNFYAVDNETLQYAKENASRVGTYNHSSGTYTGYFDNDNNLMYATLNNDIDATHMVSSGRYNAKGKEKVDSVYKSLLGNSTEQVTNYTPTPGGVGPTPSRITHSSSQMVSGKPYDPGATTISPLTQQQVQPNEMKPSVFTGEQQVVNDTKPSVFNRQPKPQEPPKKPEKLSRRQQNKLKNQNRQQKPKPQQQPGPTPEGATDFTIDMNADEFIDFNSGDNVISKELKTRDMMPTTIVNGEQQYAERTSTGVVTNGRTQSIEYQAGDRHSKYDIKYGKDGTVSVFDEQGLPVTSDTVIEDLYNISQAQEGRYFSVLNDREWDTVINNAEEFGFNQYKATDPNNIMANKASKIKNQNDAIAKRKEVLKQQIDGIGSQLEGTKDKKAKEKLKTQRNSLNIKNLEAERQRLINDHNFSALSEKQKLKEEFQKATGLDKLNKSNKKGKKYRKELEKIKSAEGYEEALAKYKKGVKGANKARDVRIASTNKNIDGQIKGWEAPGFKPSQMINVAFSAKVAIDKYKESRAEGKGVISSAARSAAGAVITETVGLGGTLMIGAAKALPQAAIKGTEMLYAEHRRMNSASNFRPLGGVSFQDNQQLATMRQSGMELAKMAQYNLEQTLMGAEAKHLHR